MVFENQTVGLITQNSPINPVLKIIKKVKLVNVSPVQAVLMRNDVKIQI